MYLLPNTIKKIVIFKIIRYTKKVLSKVVSKFVKNIHEINQNKHFSKKSRNFKIKNAQSSSVINLFWVSWTNCHRLPHPFSSLSVQISVKKNTNAITFLCSFRSCLMQDKLICLFILLQAGIIRDKTMEDMSLYIF